MVGYQFLNKKEFHPGSFGNIERVYLAEREAEEKKRLILEKEKQLKEEKY